MSLERDPLLSDAYLARFTDIVADLFCAFDAGGIIRFVSAGAPVLGYEREELLGTNLFDLILPADAAATAKHIAAIKVGGPPARFENQCKNKHGEYQWVTWTVSRDADDTCTAVIRDATERKWVERELEASLSLVEATLESTADGILVATKSGTVVTFNRRLLSMWTMSDAVVFAGAAEIDSFCDPLLVVAAGHLSLMRELEETLTSERYEVMTLADGRVFERYSQPRMIRDENEGRVWSFRDVTERVRAERELREHLSMGIEHAVEGIARLDENGRYTSVNAVFAKIFGYGEDELLGVRWGKGVHSDDRAAVVAAREATAPGEKSEVEGRVFRKDGSLVVARALLVATSGVNGPNGHHVFMRDITEQREMQERLLLADRMASMGTLAAGVAHEINNPLSFVIANVGLLTELLPALAVDSSDPRLREATELLSDVRDGAERVRKIVRDLKMFSRPEDTKSGTVDVRQVLESSVNMAWNEVRHRARLVKDYGASVMVEGNDAQLGQVFVNLLVNAAQAIPEGSVERNEIRVVTTLDPHDDRRVIVEIHDTGVGIPPAVLPHIFDPFFTTKPVGLGTGLGLSVCHGIVTKFGGDIQVESKPGVGTTFRVLLRRGADRPKTERPPPMEAPSQATPPRSRLLVVDDEAMVGNSLRRILTKDYDVVVCSSGRDALAAVAKAPQQPAFDLILCDVMMPDVTGMDVYEELSRSSPGMAARMVFMTGGTFTARAKDFLDKVANPRLDKPIDVKALRTWVRKRLTGEA